MAIGHLLTTLKKVSDRRLSRSRSGRDGGLDRHTQDLIQKAINRLQQVNLRNTRSGFSPGCSCTA